MAKQQDKAKVIEELRERVRSAKALYFVDFTGVSANDFNEMRRRARQQQLSVKVVKNTLVERVLEEFGAPAGVNEILRGPTSIMFSLEDPVAPARLLREMKDRMPAIKFKGAYFENTVYPANQFDFLATLPTKDDLRAQLVGVLSGPISGLVQVLSGLLGELVWVLEQLPGLTGEKAPDAQ